MDAAYAGHWFTYFVLSFVFGIALLPIMPKLYPEEDIMFNVFLALFVGFLWPLVMINMAYGVFKRLWRS
jgi:uncharacterized membrane protein